MTVVEPGYPSLAPSPYPSFVSAVDDDGNEVAGIRLPDVAALPQQESDFAFFENTHSADQCCVVNQPTTSPISPRQIDMMPL